MWITSLKQCQHNLPKSVERVFLSARILFVYGVSQMGILLQYSCLCLAPCAVCTAMNVLQRAGGFSLWGSLPGSSNQVLRI